ncbi:FAD-dependent oxidoreductase [Jiella marina]|uniref:FAD-dependent oxidoreductase n=1 Tax=Jiella sp. LLJ827 TaxID=2917712 RepID=UPI002100C537|nr:FAD-dependent oxidoreductase [Jiella sp. LLJ827]MCQ0989487.1 FAD-dependent oxidoreductase [Jiella sp. LLJ827]
MKDIVLIGGGHAHLFVLEAFARRPLADVHLTLVAKEAMAPYSGMLPGRVSGQYPIDSGEIDLARLAKGAGARFIHAPATGIDRANRTIQLAGHDPIGYSLLSLDVGIVPDVSNIPGAEDHGLIVKPISVFRSKWEALLDGAREGKLRHLVVVGGGPAGFELAHALRRRFRECGAIGDIAIALVAGRRFLAGLPEHGRKLARRSLAEADITLYDKLRATRIEPDEVILEGRQAIPADAVLVTTGAKAPQFLGASGLSVDERGFMRVHPTLQAENDDRIFGGGDCVALIGQERPKAGVFAVREGPVLADNLRLAALGGVLRRYDAQREYLMLLALWNGEAIGARNGLAVRSSYAFRLKDRIDRRFVDRFAAIG